jgi:CHAT domain-containing protein
MLHRGEVVTLPSVSTLAFLRADSAVRSPTRKFIAVMADPVFDGEDPRVVQNPGTPRVSSADGPSVGTPDVHRSAAEAGIGRLERLRFSRREADVIQTLVSPDERLTALDFDAGRETILAPAMRDYRIIHIATHGLINSQHPELSGLVFSLVDQHGQAQDGFVKSFELYKLRLGADLVVLSACQTALGEQIRGEGLISLTRPFMYAGVPRVVASLWQVSDRATAELMTLFYRGMVRDHLSPAAALRSAQLSLSKSPRWSRPYFWAGFTLQGDWR